MASRIEDYALIGDCHAAALVGKDGSIDWLCLPRFDSGACFAALLGTPQNGHWRIEPAGEVKSVRRGYREGTLLLETDFQTADGAVTVIDFMPLRTAVPQLVRLVVGRHGRVRMRMKLVLRFDYGSAVPWVRQLEGGRGIRATAGPDTIYCRTPVELRGENLTTVAEFDVSADQRVPFTLVWCPTYQDEPPQCDAERALDETDQWWRAWSGKCQYHGKWREAVLRSLITLKALTYVPTGGIVAAATTSLPERIGGQRNWDYRYCWLRDATFTLMALDLGGYTDEAKAWRKWLLNAVAGAADDIQIMYGVAGERRLPEMTLPWLKGYENSLPVRVGNAAFEQRQLDVFGEVADAMFQSRKIGLHEDDDMWRLEKGLIACLQERWRQPDQGIWEIRGPARHFTYSKIMAWVAMDRAIKTVEHFGHGGDARKWRAVRDEIHAQVCEQAFNVELNSFVQYYGSKDPDASLLMLPLVGFLPPNDPRIRGTIDFIRGHLLSDGFVRRYPSESGVDALPSGEGAFLICTFWLADNLALTGRHREAEELFERLLCLRNDVGLLSEEYDPIGKRLVGNFPQAFSHVGLINTARNLSSPGGPAEHRPHHMPR
jgi:GH15 family glucan-1,4-alpha-glucosidase